MSLEAFSIKWFSIYYAVFGLILLISGLFLLLKPAAFNRYLQKQAANEQPPLLLLKILKYLFFFTVPCLILSFFPFSWLELLFSIWSLFIVYLAGSQLLRWSRLRELITTKKHALLSLIRWLGVSMLSSAAVILLLDYLVIRRLQEF